jgi:hypothetical protein
MFDYLPSFFGSPKWAYAPIVLFALGSFILAVRAVYPIVNRQEKTATDNFSKWPEPYKAISIIGKTFRNEKVLLDGNAYSGCEFYNVTFVYNGTTPIQFANNKINGQIIIASDNLAVLGTLALTVGFNILKDEIKILDLPPGAKLERGKNVSTPQ